MARIKTLTVKQIRNLTMSRDMAEDWRGNHNPESYDEFDAWIAEIDAALEQVKLDRQRLRAALDFIEKSPCDPDITKEQLAAWNKLQKLEARNGN